MGKTVPGIISHFSASRKERGLLEIGPELTQSQVSFILKPVNSRQTILSFLKSTFSLDLEGIDNEMPEMPNWKPRDK